MPVATKIPQSIQERWQSLTPSDDFAIALDFYRTAGERKSHRFASTSTRKRGRANR